MAAQASGARYPTERLLKPTQRDDPRLAPTPAAVAASATAAAAAAVDMPTGLVDFATFVSIFRDLSGRLIPAMAAAATVAY